MCCLNPAPPTICFIYAHSTLSQRLSSVDQNYYIDNPELLAVKIALEECRYQLEEAEQPFRVWIDHQNLFYI